MSVVHGHTDLRGIPLPQDIGENYRMFVHHSVFIGPPLHESIRHFIEVE